jgi:hypothetical protein
VLAPVGLERPSAFAGGLGYAACRLSQPCLFGRTCSPRVEQFAQRIQETHFRSPSLSAHELQRWGGRQLDPPCAEGRKHYRGFPLVPTFRQQGRAAHTAHSGLSLLSRRGRLGLRSYMSLLGFAPAPEKLPRQNLRAGSGQSRRQQRHHAALFPFRRRSGRRGQRLGAITTKFSPTLGVRRPLL